MPTVINGTTGITTDAINATSGNTSLTTLNVASNAISAVNSLGFRNRIINGAMVIDQRNNGASVSVVDNYTIDRWAAARFGGAATMTAQRSTVAPAGFTNSLLFTIGTGATPTGTDQTFTEQRIEGFNIYDLGWGTSAAQAVTVSFWVRSSVTGTYGLTARNSANNRAYVASYTVSAANTLEYKTVTIPGDTSGTWAVDNVTGFRIMWDLGAGPTYSQAAGSWTSGSLISGLTGGVKLVSTSGATFYITGVQLEAGTVASPFERRDYGREFIMCQRYYEVTNWVVTTDGANGAYQNIGSWQVTKRTTPTMVTDTGAGGSFVAVGSSGFRQDTNPSAFTGVFIRGSAEL